MRLEIISFTPAGGELGRRLEKLLIQEGCRACHINLREAKNKELYPPTLDHWVRRGFGLDLSRAGDFAENTPARQRCRKGKNLPAGGPAQGLIFIGAAGIAVRGIAPYIKSKTCDPAVVVLDEKGEFAIPLLSGHIGGANRLARLIGRLCGARAVITTATDVGGFFAVDEWAVQRGLSICNPQRIKAVSSRLLAGQPVFLAADFPAAGPPPPGITLVREKAPDPGPVDSGLTKSGPVLAGLEKGPADSGPQPAHIRISCRRPPGRDLKEERALVLVPRVLTAGIGCRRDTPAEIIRAAVENALAAAGVYPQALARVASIDLKAGEPGLLEYCRENRLPYVTYSAEELAAVRGDFTSSEFVAGVAGVDNVCERAAVLASRGKLILKKQAAAGVTVALAAAPYEIDFNFKEYA